MKSVGFALFWLLCVKAWAQDVIEPLDLKVFTFEDEEYALGLYDKVNWYEANLICASKDYTLVSLSSYRQQDNLVDWIKAVATDYIHILEEEPLWTSGTNLGDNFRYVWQSTGKPVFFNNFLSDPLTTVPRCVGTNGYTGFWSDHDCEERLYFVCEKVKKESKC